MLFDTFTAIRKQGQSKSMTVLLCGLLLATSFLFLYRSVLRTGDRGDMISPYVAAIRFVHHADPYTLKHFVEDWHASGAPATRPLRHWMDAVAYPPTTLLVFSPFTLFRWGAATKLYIWICAALYGVLVWRLALQVGIRWTDARRLLFACFGLTLAPVQTGVHEANLSILAFLCCAFSLLLVQAEMPIGAGLLLMLGVFVKPTVGFTLLLFLLAIRRWRALAVFVGSAIVLAGLTEMVMMKIDPVWKQHYREAVAIIVSNNGPGSFTSNSMNRFDLINLQLPVYELSRSAIIANAVAWSVALLLLVRWGVTMMQKRRHAESWDWAAVTAILLISLIPVYQRNYNAAVLLFGVVWAFQHVEQRLAKTFLAVSVFFLIPGEAWLRNWLSPKLPTWITGGKFWLGILLPQAAWAVVPLTLLMLLAMRKRVAPIGVRGVQDDGSLI